MSKEFKPKPGQIDFTHARWAPVINCVVKFKDKILVVKRSGNLNLYPGYWNGISGFLDDRRGLEEKVKDELKEEAGIAEDNIISIRVGPIFDLEDPPYKKTWVVHPVLIKVKTDRINLNWEAQEYKWVSLEEIKDLKAVRGFEMVIAKLFLEKKQ